MRSVIAVARFASRLGLSEPPYTEPYTTSAKLPLRRSQREFSGAPRGTIVRAFFYASIGQQDLGGGSALGGKAVDLRDFGWVDDIPT